MQLDRCTVAVTGASGFFGAHIASVLLRKGCRVRAVVRHPHRLPGRDRSGMEVAQADLLDPEALEAAFRGVDAVVGNAAMATPAIKGWEDNYLPNKVGTENVLDAMDRAGVRRYIHISTIGVYDIPPTRLFGRKPFAEDHPLVTIKHRRLVGAYRVTKALAEQAARDRCRLYGIDLTILRTSATYGYRDPTILPAVRRAMKLPVLPAPNLAFSLVYAGDAAAAVAEAIARDISRGKTYNVAGAPENTLRTLLVAWQHVTGERTRLLTIPTPIRIMFDSSAATRDLGFRNRPMEEAIREVLDMERAENAETQYR